MVIRNNQFIICNLASFSSKDSKYVFGCAIFFKAMIVYAWPVTGGLCSSSEEAWARIILFSLRKAKEFHLYHLYHFLILTDSIEVVFAIKGKEDWILWNCVADILDISKSFVSILIRCFSRDLNVAVHAFTKFCSKFDMNSKYFDCFSYWLVG